MKRIIFMILILITIPFGYDKAVFSQKDRIARRIKGSCDIRETECGKIWTEMETGEEFQFLRDVSDPIRSQVQYVLKTNQSEYDYGRDIDACFSLRNDSEISVAYSIFRYRYGEPYKRDVSHGVNQWIIVDENDQPIPLTLWGKWDTEDVYADDPELKAQGEPKYFITFNGQTRFFILIPSGCTYRFEGDIPLNRHLDLSCPGTYRAKAVRIAEYPHPDPQRKLKKPLESNTVEFRIRYGSEFTERPLENMHITPQRLEDLPPSGDYSQLRLIVQSDRSRYQRMQPLFVHCFLKNESESEVHLCVDPSMFWRDQRWVVTNESGEEVPLTRMGQLRFGKEPPSASEIDWCFSEPCFVVLPPGETVEIIPGAIQLNRYFDLTLPGKYKFKSLRNTVIPGQKFDSPLESNEVEFEIK